MDPSQSSCKLNHRSQASAQLPEAGGKPGKAMKPMLGHCGASESEQDAC